MSNFIETYNRVLKNEGGYNKPYGGSGETYKGIDRKFNPDWPGWKIIDTYKAVHGIPPEEYQINDPQLENLVSAFYQVYINKIVPIESVQNQTLSNMIADFITHKLYDAVAVMNSVAATMFSIDYIRNLKPAYAAPTYSKTSITPVVLDLMNTQPQAFYLYLKDFRIKYYQNPSTFGSSLKFSIPLQESFINRVKSFPDQA